MKNISENIREKSFTFQWGVSQWMKHLRILHTAARASALCLAAPHCPCAEGHACQEQHWHGHMHGPLAERCGVLSSPFTAGKGRITPLPEELLHMLGARFQGNQLQSHKFPFLSSPTTDSTGLLIANAVLICRTPFVWILGLDSHWHSHSQPHYLQIFRVHVHSPPQPGTWQGVLSSAPGPSQEVAN